MYGIYLLKVKNIGEYRSALHFDTAKVLLFFEIYKSLNKKNAFQMQNYLSSTAIYHFKSINLALIIVTIYLYIIVCKPSHLITFFF